jgi:tetratricopeptide (TPR) repeat protein
MICTRFLIPLGFILTAEIFAQTPPPPPPAPAPRAVVPAAPEPFRVARPMPRPAAAPVAPEDLRDLLDREPPLPPAAAIDRAGELLDRLAEPAPLPALAPLPPDWHLATPMPAPRPFAFDFQDGPMLLAQRMAGFGGRNVSEDRLYESGQSALDSHRYDSALEDFNQVASRGGSRADAGWYWKAYTLNKLGRRDEALAALAELRKSFPNSRWLDDAKALELEVKQQAGKPVSPDSESDEDLKLMAINGLMQSDPDRAVPLVENILKGSQPPRLKERALYVLAVSNSPKAQQMLEQIARGSANPDLQLRAIRYIGSVRRKQGNTNTTPAILNEIYASSNDVNVKRAILNTYLSNRDSQRLLEVAKNEKNPDLRRDAFRFLGENTGQPELWQIYQAETSPDVKEQILQCMYNNGNAEKLAEVVRTEKDPKLRRIAIRVLATERNANMSDTLVALYSSEQDPQNKRSIVDMLYSRGNAKSLIEIARAEKDTKAKLHIVEMLSNMKSKEAQDYLMEILSK